MFILVSYFFLEAVVTYCISLTCWLVTLVYFILAMYVLVSLFFTEIVFTFYTSLAVFVLVNLLSLMFFFFLKYAFPFPRLNFSTSMLLSGFTSLFSTDSSSFFSRRRWSR